MRTATGVKPKLIEVHVPQLFPTLSTMDMLTIEKWYVAENDVVQPGDLLISLEAPPGFFDIPTPPDVTGPCRVARMVAQGEQVRLGSCSSSWSRSPWVSRTIHTLQEKQYPPPGMRQGGGYCNGR